eukprot:gene12785-7057_t
MTFESPRSEYMTELKELVSNEFKAGIPRDDKELEDVLLEDIQEFFTSFYNYFGGVFNYNGNYTRLPNCDDDRERNDRIKNQKWNGSDKNSKNFTKNKRILDINKLSSNSTNLDMHSGTTLRRLQVLGGNSTDNL